MNTFLRCLSFGILLLHIPIANAEITEIRYVGNKRIICTRSGLISSVKDCGTPDWYKYVFIGSISAIRDLEKDEKEIQVIPEELFSGTPPSPLTLRTSQGACFPPIAVGDRWLFYLAADDPINIDYYGGKSRPLSEAAMEIDTLRRLKSIGNRGLLRGHVVRGDIPNLILWPMRE